MATNTDETKMPKKLPSTTPLETEQSKAEVAAAEDEGVEPASAYADEPEGLEELPEGAVLLGVPMGDSTVSEVIAAATGDGAIAPVLAPVHQDEYVGQGGTYIRGDDGVRRPAYEKVMIPGRKKGEMVARYRRVL